MTVKTKSLRFAERVSNVPQSFVREILKVTSNPDVVSFAGGLPNPALFPTQEMALCAVKVLQNQGQQALQYSQTEGLYPLREFIANRYSENFSLKISPDQILITNGSQQALDLIGKIYLNPGDTVLLERPTYLGALQSLSMFQPRFEEVRLLEDGIDTDEFNFKLTHDPKLFYCIPNFQNPTGLQYSNKKRKEIAEIVTRSNMIIVEDDPYGEIRFTDEQPAPIYSFLPDQTILLGSFSKSIAPGLRLGWMVATQQIIQKATVMKQASDLHSGNLTQHILMEYLKTYNLDEHLQKIRQSYQYQSQVMQDCMKQYFPKDSSYTEPKGGMFTWVTLPDGITARQLLTKALEQNVIFVPGDTFYAANSDTQTLRLNYSNVDEKTMRIAMKKLGTLIYQL